MAALSAGCIILPLPAERTQAPPIGEVLPVDLRGSDEPAILLTEFSRCSGFFDCKRAELVEPPVVTTVRELDAEVRRLDTSSAPRTFIAIGGPGGGFGGVSAGQADVLFRACVLTPSGRQIKLTPAGGKWIALDLPMHANRRDAIVTALANTGEAPFAAVDGPCGVKGQVRWSSQERKTLRDLLQRMPVRRAADVLPELATILAGAEAARGHAPPGNTMVIQTIGWPSTEPLYLRLDDFARFKALAGRVSAAEFAALLPAYQTGRLALESLSPEKLCIVSPGGELLRWKAGFRSPESARVDAAWIGKSERRLAGDIDAWDWDEPCALGRGMSWEPAHTEAARSFLQSLRPAVH